MAPLMHLYFRKVLLFLLFLSAASVFVFVSSESNDNYEVDGSKQFAVGERKMLESEDKDLKINMKRSSSITQSKNHTKLIKSNVSSKNKTKAVKNSINMPSKNQTKIMKTTTTSANSTKSATLKKSNGDNLSKSELKKLNSTSELKKLNSTSKVSKSSNSTKLSSSSSLKKSSDLSKNNKTTKPTTTKQAQAKPNQRKNQSSQKHTKAISFLDDGDDDDLVSEFRDLPIKFQQTLIPDLERISTTSKAYINRYNKEITKGFKPIVGSKYAATIASIVSFAFIVIPLILVSLIFNRIKAYFSLQKILIFIQVYLSIYFSILCLSSLGTGLEPLKFFYATSQSTYVCVQLLQTLGYILYLLMLLMYLILVFSTNCSLAPRMLGLAQTFVGCAVGLHYYVAVFHRLLLHQPPKTNWKVHGIYATCFLLICLFASAETRKKSYLEEGGEEGKKN